PECEIGPKAGTGSWSGHASRGDCWTGSDRIFAAQHQVGSGWLWKGRKASGSTNGQAASGVGRNPRTGRCGRCISHCNLPPAHFGHARTAACCDMTLPRARVDEYGSAARDSFRGAAAMRRLLAIFIWALGTVFCALGAQTPSASPDESQTQLPSISFTLDFPGSDPDHYSFKVD